ncbi:MAG: hypothetical protein AAGJ08_19225 [Cyanobacteria bacterium P01_H01_bin.35]
MSQKIDIPESLSTTFSGIFFFGVGLYVLFTSELTTLKCKRLQLNQRVTCEVTYYGLLGKRTIPIPAGVLQGAETHRKGTGRHKGYKVVLLTEIDEIPIHGLSSTSSEIVASKKAEQINNFVNNPEQMSLEMLQHPNWLLVFVAIIFFIMPVLLLLLVLLISMINFLSRSSR